jgi:hypothetical protein
MPKCGSSVYDMIDYGNLFDLKNAKVVRAQLNQIDRGTNTADITLLDYCPEVTAQDLRKVKFFYHCQYSSGSELDLSKGHRAFHNYEMVYVLYAPASPGVEKRLYIIGHVDKQDTALCTYGDYILVLFTRLGNVGEFEDSMAGLDVYDTATGKSVDLDKFINRNNSPAKPASLPFVYNAKDIAGNTGYSDFYAWFNWNFMPQYPSATLPTINHTETSNFWTTYNDASDQISYSHTDTAVFMNPDNCVLAYREDSYEKANSTYPDWRNDFFQWEYFDTERQTYDGYGFFCGQIESSNHEKMYTLNRDWGEYSYFVTVAGHKVTFRVRSTETLHSTVSGASPSFTFTDAYTQSISLEVNFPLFGDPVVISSSFAFNWVDANLSAKPTNSPYNNSSVCNGTIGHVGIGDINAASTDPNPYYDQTLTGDRIGSISEGGAGCYVYMFWWMSAEYTNIYTNTIFPYTLSPVWLEMIGSNMTPSTGYPVVFRGHVAVSYYNEDITPATTLDLDEMITNRDRGSSKGMIDCINRLVRDVTDGWKTIHVNWATNGQDYVDIANLLTRSGPQLVFYQRRTE